jgi:hypothetical protein
MKNWQQYSNCIFKPIRLSSNRLHFIFQLRAYFWFYELARLLTILIEHVPVKRRIVLTAQLPIRVTLLSKVSRTMLSIMNVSERPIEGDSDKNKNKMIVFWSAIGESNLITPFALILSSYLCMLIETVYKQSDAVTNQSVGKDAAAVETDENAK